MKSLLTLLFLSLGLAVQAADTPTPTPEPTPVFETGPSGEKVQILRNGIKFHYGPYTAKLGDKAEVKVPAGFIFVGQDSMKAFMEATQNFYSDNELGVILSDTEGWALYFDYDDSGHVKDDDKSSLDADDLYKKMVSRQEDSNEERKARKWDELKFAGWAAKPHYDEKTNNLKWALRLTSSRDNHKDVTINESIRLLGRTGVMNVTLACSDQVFASTEKTADNLLKDFGFVAGHRYAEFKSGDKIAEYGLAALVLGGAGAVAYKSGLLAKFGKLIVVAAAGLFGLLAKLWNKITGKNKE